MAQLTGYLAAPGFEDELKSELGDVAESYGPLMLAPGEPRLNIAWAQNIWLNPEIIAIDSISDASKKLRARAPRWALLPHAMHRRAHLIEEKIPKAKPVTLDFLAPLPDKPIGSWLMIESGKILASPQCSSRLPHGEFKFNEDKVQPPSRAYLKLWELFTVHNLRPQKGQRVVDAGACPGGWTWVLASMGCEVLSIDKAPLDERVARNPLVRSIKEDAFELKPERLGKVDWFFSDIICEPKRLEKLIATWLESGLCENFVCTIKFKGETEHAVAGRLASIPGAQLRHLVHNKHELTWWLHRAPNSIAKA